MNTYLEKVAKSETYKKATATVGGAVGLGLVHSSTGKILGYHTVRHGTTGEAAKSIKKDGLKASMGGTGASTMQDDYIHNSRGKVHVTKSRLMSHVYAGNIGKHAKDLDGHGSHARAFGRILKDRAVGGKVVSARVSHSQWNRFKVDNDSTSPMDGSEEFRKGLGSTYSRDISSKQIKGGKGSKGILPYLSKKNMSRYLSTASGRARASVGAAQLVAGSGLAAYAAKRLTSKEK